VLRQHHHIEFFGVGDIVKYQSPGPGDKVAEGGTVLIYLARE